MKKLLSVVLLAAMCVSMLPAMVVGAATATPSAEMLTNPGMMPQEGEDQGWYNYAEFETAFEFTTDEKRGGEGDYSMLMGHDTRVATQSIDFDPAKAYKFSVWVKGNGRYKISVLCHDENGKSVDYVTSWVEDTWGPVYISEKDANYEEWTQKTIYISAGNLVPETTKSFYVVINTIYESEANKLYFDDASLVAYDLGTDVSGAANINPAMGVQGDWTALNKTVFDTEEFHSAPVSAKVNYDGTNITAYKEASYQAYSLESETLYELSVWLKSNTGAPVRVALHTNDVWKAMITVTPTNEWKLYRTYFNSKDVTASDKRCQIIVEARTGGSAGDIWVDDVVLRKAQLPADGEMLYDPGMEQIATGWYSVESGWEYTTAENKTGAQSIKASSTSVFATPKYELDKSKIYDFSIYAKGTGRVYLYVKFYDKDNNALTNLAGFGDPNYGFAMFKDTAANYSDWKKLSFSFSSLGILVPETASTFRIAVRSLDNVFYYDDASLVAHDPGVTLNSDGNIVPNPTMGSEGELWAYTNAEADYSEYHSAPVSVKLKHDAAAISNDATVLSEASDSLYKLDLNKIYEYSVWLKTDNCTNVTVRLSGNDRNDQATLADFNVTNEWKQYKVYFKPSEVGLANAANKFKVILSSRKGGTTGNIWVDDVILREANASDINLLQDPTFAKSLTWDGYWRLQRGEFIKNDGHTPDGCVRMGFVKSNGGTVAEDSVNLMGMKKGIASNSGKENYAVLDMNKEYELRFWAKKEGADDNSVINVLTGTADNEHAYSTVKVYPTTEWAEYKVLVNVGKVVDYWLNKDSSATEFYYTPYFSIWTADNFEGAVYIDDVTLHEVELGYADELSYVDTSVAKVSVSGNAVTGQVYFNGAAGDVSYIAAVYSGNILKDCAVVEETAAVGNNEFAMTLNRAVAAGDTVKLFVWSAEGGLAPVKASNSVNIK